MQFATATTARVFGLIVLIAFASLSPRAVSQSDSQLGDIVDRSELDDAVVNEELDPIDEQLSKLNLIQKISQLMFVTFEGTQAPSSIEREVLYGFTPGGVILPKIGSPQAFANYRKELERNQLQVARDVPLFVATDYYALSSQDFAQHRFPPVPPPLALGAGADSGSTEESARLIAEYLGAMGVNVHIGPTLAMTPTLPDARKNVALFGQEPTILTQVARDYGSQFKNNNVAWIPVGFPGGGANRLLREPPVLSTPRVMLGSNELAPYVAAIESGSRFMHVGNILTPTLTEDGSFASLSTEVIQKLLREELGFNGIVVAGPMNDPLLHLLPDPTVAPELAIRAGADMLWWMNTGPQSVQAVLRIAQAVQDGRISESEIDDRVRRILRIKREMELSTSPLPLESEIKKFVREREKVDPIILKRLEASGIVLVKARSGVLPLTNEDSAPVGITGVAGVELLYEALEKKIEPLARYEVGTAKHGKQLFDFEIDRIMRSAQGTRTAICVFSSDVMGQTQRQLIRALSENGSQIVTVLLGVPKELNRYADASDALFVVLRPSSGRLDATMSALADTLRGVGPIRLLEPMRPLTIAANETVSFDIAELAMSPPGKLPLDLGEDFPTGFSLGFPAIMDDRRVEWSFGDGTIKSGLVVEHTYQEPGQYFLIVSVSDKHVTLATQTYTVQAGAQDSGAP